MTSQQGYGAPVDTDDISSALESTLLLRLALNVLWNGLPEGMTTGPVRDALETIHNRINEIETAGLRRWGPSRALPHRPTPQPGQPARATDHGQDNHSRPHPRRPRNARGTERRRLPG
jgi:hypothetical protein